MTVSRGMRMQGALVLSASLALSGCSGYSPMSQFIMPSFPGLGDSAPPPVDMQGKGTVALAASIDGMTCAESRVTLAREASDGYTTTGVYAIDSRFGTGKSAALVDLPPGTYHVVQVACRNGTKVVYAGDSGTAGIVPWQGAHWRESLASFAVVAGDAVAAGEIVVVPAKVKGFSTSVTGRAASVSVRQLDGAALGQLAGERAELAGHLKSGPMLPSQGVKLALAKCQLVAKRTPLPKDGSSNMPDLVQQHPESAPVVDELNASTREAVGCTPDQGLANPLQ